MPIVSGLVLLAPPASVIAIGAAAREQSWVVIGSVLSGLILASLLAVARAISLSSTVRAERAAREVVEHELIEVRRRLDRLENDGR